MRETIKNLWKNNANFEILSQGIFSIISFLLLFLISIIVFLSIKLITQTAKRIIFALSWQLSDPYFLSKLVETSKIQEMADLLLLFEVGANKFSRKFKTPNVCFRHFSEVNFYFNLFRVTHKRELSGKPTREAPAPRLGGLLGANGSIGMQFAINLGAK